MEDPLQNGYPGYCLDTPICRFGDFWGTFTVYGGYIGEKGGFPIGNPYIREIPLKRAVFVKNTPFFPFFTGKYPQKGVFFKKITLFGGF